MHLSITTTHEPATDLGYLLHKNPSRVQTFTLPFGRALVYFPEVSHARCTVCLTIDIDAIGLVRGQKNTEGILDHYVNDRPYVSSSFLSVAISQIFGTALQGRSRERGELAEQAIPLVAELPCVCVRGGENLLHKLFEPLGYIIEATSAPLDEQHPEWGQSPYYSIRLTHNIPLSLLLTHLYVLLPVLDNAKHYYISEDEVDKLVSKGGEWLATHPEQSLIVQRYLRRLPSLARLALAQLEDRQIISDEDEPPQQVACQFFSLNQQRISSVTEKLCNEGVNSVLDLGCGEGQLLQELLHHKQFAKIVGMDVSIRALEIASSRLKLQDMRERQRERIALMQGSVSYRDNRMQGFDAIVLVEVIEHLDPFPLRSLEHVIFRHAKPRMVLLTTPNKEYNCVWEKLGSERLRHDDHRFEWTRTEFRAWANALAERVGYCVEYFDIGEQHSDFGSPTQGAIFRQRQQSKADAQNAIPEED